MDIHICIDYWEGRARKLEDCVGAFNRYTKTRFLHYSFPSGFFYTTAGTNFLDKHLEMLRVWILSPIRFNLKDNLLI